MSGMNAHVESVADRLLVVALDAEFRDAAANIAEKLGYELYSTGYSADFRKIVLDLAPTVVILDVDLLNRQRTGALAFLARLESRPRVLLLTSAESDSGVSLQQLVESLNLDVVEILSHPVDMDKLQGTMQSLRIADDY